MAVVTSAFAFAAKAVAAVKTAGALALTKVGLSKAASFAAMSVAANLAANAALGATINALAPKPKVATAQLQVTVGATGPRTFLMGRTYVKGQRATPEPLRRGKNNRVVSCVYLLSGIGPSGSVKSIIFKGETITFDANGYAIGTFSDVMRLRQASGDWTQSALFSDWQGSSYDVWPSTARCAGCLTVMMEYHAESTKFGGGLEDPTFVVEADLAALVDPRTASAATTWAQRQNPAVWTYSFLLGFYSPAAVAPSGAGTRLAGLGLPTSQIDTAWFASWANVCDTRGYRIGGEGSTAEDPQALLLEMMRTGAAVPCERFGLQSGIVSEQQSIVTTLTEDDLIGAPSYGSAFARHALPNRLVPRARHEASRGEMVDYTAVTDNDWLTADGGIQRSVTVDWPFAGGSDSQRAQQVATLTRLEAENSREPLVVTVTVQQHKRWSALVGDRIETQWPRLGLNGRKWLVTAVEHQEQDGAAVWTLLSETDAKYARAFGTTATPVAINYTPIFDGLGRAGGITIGNSSAGFLTLPDGGYLTLPDGGYLTLPGTARPDEGTPGQLWTDGITVWRADDAGDWQTLSSQDFSQITGDTKPQDNATRGSFRGVFATASEATIAGVADGDTWRSNATGLTYGRFGGVDTALADTGLIVALSAYVLQASGVTNVETASVTASTTGASGAVTWQWVKLSGPSSHVAVTPTAATTIFRRTGTMPAGASETSGWQVVATDAAGRTASIALGITFDSTA